MFLSSTLDTLLALQDALDVAQDTGYFEGATTNTGVYPPINIFEKAIVLNFFYLIAQKKTKTKAN